MFCDKVPTSADIEHALVSRTHSMATKHVLSLAHKIDAKTLLWNLHQPSDKDSKTFSLKKLAFAHAPFWI